MVEVLIFLAGVGTGVGASVLRIYALRHKEQMAAEAKATMKRARAQKAADKRRAKALKVADQAQAKQAYNDASANETRPNGAASNGAASWSA